MAFVKERNGVKGKTFQVRYRINSEVNVETFSYKDYFYTKQDKDGNPIKNSLKVAEKEAEKAAYKFASEIEAQKTLGIAKDESKMSFSEYAEIVFKIHDRNASFQTKRNRMYALNVINEHIGNIKLKDLSATKIEMFFSEMSEDKSDQVLMKYKIIINIVLDYAFSKDLITINPMLKVKFKISQKNLKEVKAIDIEVFNEYIYHALEEPKYYYPIMLMYYTGMRVGECLAIKKSDFDFDKLEYQITKSMRRDGVIVKPKKNKIRTGPIHEELSELFYEIITWQEYNKRNFGSDYQENNLLICDYDGKPIKYNALKKYLERLDKVAGVKIRPHQLRHTFATLMNEMGVNPKDIQQLLGHAKITTTMNVYQHLTNNIKSDTIQKVNEIYKNVKPIQK